MTQTMKASEVRQQWSQTLNKVFRKNARIIVEKSGIPVAAVIPAEDLERFKRLEEQREQNFSILDEIGEKFKEVPPEEIEREVRKALKEVRVEMKAESSIDRNSV